MPPKAKQPPKVVVDTPAPAPAPAPEPDPPTTLKVRIIQVDTRSAYDNIQGPMRTWPTKHDNHSEMHHAYCVSNPPPPRRPYWTLTALNNAWHCKRMGWKYEYAHVPDPPGRHPSWVKIRHALFCWPHYTDDEIVIIIDTDAWIRDADGLAHVLETRLEGGIKYLAAGEPACNESRDHGADLVNGGFMCFKKDDKVRDYLQRVWDMPERQHDAHRYTTDWPWEQACLCRVYRADPRISEWMDILPVAMCNTPAGTHIAHCWYKDMTSDLIIDDLLSAMAQDVMSVTRPKIEFVVARYLEDVGWLNEWVPFVEKITVYDKSPEPMVSSHPKITVVPLPNVGRESHTYAHHFTEHHGDLCDIVVCTQGRYDDHLSKGEFDAMVRGKEQATANGLDVGWSKCPMMHFGWTSDANYQPQHTHYQTQPMRPANMSMGKYFLKYIADDLLPEDQLKWWLGGIFRIPRDNITRHSADKYRAIRDTLDAGPNPETGHMMERFWRSLLIPPHY